MKVNYQIKTTILMVSYSKDSTGKPLLIVAKKENENSELEIVNAFEGEKADKLYNSLITKEVKS